MFLFLRRRKTQNEPIDEKLQVKPFNAVQATLAPIDESNPPTTSDPSLDPHHGQSQMRPFMTSGEMRKGQVPMSRYTANPGERSDHVSTSSISDVQAGGRGASAVRSVDPNATTSRVGDEAFPPDYAQATESLRRS